MISKPSFSLGQLRFLVSLARHQHFGRAARDCFVTQSTLSVGIKNLEETLGVRFAERTNRKVLMTPLGKELADHARLVLSEAAKLTETASGHRQALSGSLRLGIIPTISPFALPKVLPRIRRRHPRLRLSVKEGFSDDIYEDLLDGALDLIMLALPYDLDRLEVISLFKDPFFLVYHEDCDIKMKTFRIEELKDGSILLLKDGHCLRDHALSACDIRHQNKISPYTTSSLHTLAQMVANNLGISFMPKIAIDSGLLSKTRVKIRKLPASAHREIGFAWHASSVRREEYLLLRITFARWLPQSELDSHDKMPPHALISVYDKRKLVGLARLLSARGVRLLSSAGTAAHLRRSGLDVIEVSSYTGFPEMMDGRVKTLHPLVHAGLLAREQDKPALMKRGIVSIDWLIVNFYPFVEITGRADCTWDEGIENIDVGGPAMIRAAAKNHERVTVIVDPDDYDEVSGLLRSQGGEVPLARRRALAAKAYAAVSAYDASVSHYLAQGRQSDEPALPAVLRLSLLRGRRLRYGENPHQAAAFYVTDPAAGQVRQLQGKALSYNNVVDSDLACQCAAGFERPGCAIVKHAMPCAVACADEIETAYENAYLSDPHSAYGGIVAVNKPLNKALASRLVERQFTEVVVAPQIEPEAAEVLRSKKNLRVLSAMPAPPRRQLRSVAGGFLLQTADRDVDVNCLLKTRRPVDEEMMKSLMFAWRVVRFVRSNAIVLARGERTVGVGGGQGNRSVATRLAVEQAQAVEAQGVLTMASDAFLPFRDSLDLAHQAGAQAVIQPGGSLRDKDIIAAADELGMAMVFTGVRHFSHQ